MRKQTIKKTAPIPVQKKEIKQTNKVIQKPQTHFDKLKETYAHFEQFLLKNGILLAKDTGIGYWGVTHLHALQELFQNIELQKQSHLLDLGSGDGRVVLLASLFGIRATGVEFDDWLLNSSMDIKRKLDLPHFENVKFLKEDFMRMDIKPYDILYISPDKPFHRGLDQKLSKELQGKLIVHSHEFLPKALTLEKEMVFQGEKFGIYKR